MKAEDESTVTEIELAPDGRVYVFGASRDVLESLGAIGVRESGLRDRLIDRNQEIGSQRAESSGSFESAELSIEAQNIESGSR